MDRDTTPDDLDFAMFDLPSVPAQREVETDKATRAAERDDAARIHRAEWYADKGIVPRG